MRNLSTRRIVSLAMLISLNIILTRFASVRLSVGGVEGIRVGFGTFPVILAGFCFGPLSGAIVGAMGDLVGFFLHPMGAYFPHFTFSAALTGLIPGLFALYGETWLSSVSRLMVAIGSTLAVTSLILVPWFLKILFRMPIAVTLPGASVSFALTVPIYALLVSRLLRTVPGALMVATNAVNVHRTL